MAMSANHASRKMWGGKGLRYHYLLAALGCPTYFYLVHHSIYGRAHPFRYQILHWLSYLYHDSYFLKEGKSKIPEPYLSSSKSFALCKVLIGNKNGTHYICYVESKGFCP